MSRKTRGAVIGLIALVALSIGAGAYAASSSQSVTNFVSYIGSSSKGAAKGTPVKVGFLNQQGGQVVIGAKATIGAQAAVTYINKNGGIAGHPIKLDTCFIKAAEEEGSKCAQQFLKNKDVVAATGGVVTGIQSFYKTINGKIPVVTGVATTGVDGSQKNATVLFGDSTHVLGPIGTYASKYLHAKTAAVLYPNQAATTVGGQAIIAGLKAAGIKVKSATYDEGNADLTGPLQNSGAATADIVIPYSDAAGCANLAKSLKAVGVTNPNKIVSAPALPQRRRGPGPRRELRQLDLLDRVVELRRHEGSGDGHLHEGHQGHPLRRRRT